MLRKIALMTVLLAAPAFAHDYKVGDLQIEHPYTRASAGRTGGVFLEIANKGKTADRLVSAAASIAGTVELHTTVKDGEVMRMRPVAAIDIPASGAAKLQPGGLHVMLIGLTKPLKEGESFPLTLTFEKAGKVEVKVEVQKAGSSGGGHHHGDKHGAAPTHHQHGASAADAIVALLRHSFDRPDAPLAVEPVVVNGDDAVAGWIQGDTGGRALLRRKDGAWRIVLCSGDALTKAAFLVEAGIAPPVAEAMAKALLAAESKMAPARTALFAKFDGVVMMADDGAHPPVHGTQGGHPPMKH